jgi:hypothetical protein
LKGLLTSEFDIDEVARASTAGKISLWMMSRKLLVVLLLRRVEVYPICGFHACEAKK